MTMPQTMRDNPMTWKDWITASGMALTLCTLLIMGGRILEKQDTYMRRVDEALGRLTQLEADFYRMQGVDSVQNEQLGTLRRDVDNLYARLLHERLERNDRREQRARP